MRKVVIIVIVACLVVAVILSSIFLGNSGSNASASASTVASQVEGSMVVWNRERDQKLFETTDSSAIGSVITFIKTAKWSNVSAEPTGSNVKNAYNLTIYDAQGKGEAYSMLYMNDNTIVLFYQKGNADGTYLQASFPIQTGGLNDYFKISPAVSVSPSVSASTAASASASAS